MKQIKDELQTIIIGNGQNGFTSQLKKVHNFLRGNEKTGSKLEEQKYLKSEEEQLLIGFAQRENLMKLLMPRWILIQHLLRCIRIPGITITAFPANIC